MATTVQRPTPTSKTDLDRINAMFSGVQTLLCNLRGRWEDEKKHENIDEYGKVLAQHLPEGFKLTRMTKRPFGFEFNIGTDAKYAVTTSNRAVAWKRIG